MTRRLLRDGERREIKPKGYAKISVIALREDADTPFVILSGISHTGEDDNTVYKGRFHIALEDVAVVTLIDQLQRALAILPSSK